MNARQTRFVQEYLIAPNATRAARRSGYSAKTAAVIGHQNRTDIWSLGVVLYEMLAGTPPLQGENLLSLSNAILESEHPTR